MAATVLLNNVQAEGPGTVLEIPVGVRKASFQIKGKFSGEVLLEASLDGIDWFPFEGFVVGGGRVQCVRYPCVVILDAAEAVKAVRPNVVSYEDGSITVVGYIQS